MILAALLLASPLPQEALSVGRLYGEFARVCGGAIDPLSIGGSASAGGWSPIQLEAASKLSTEVSQYDREMWAHWGFQGTYFTKNVEGRQIYLHASTGTPDGVTVHGCAIYDFDHLADPGAIKVQEAVGAKPEYITKDFGGSTYDFPTGTLPSGDHVEITWLTHKINPQFRGDLELESVGRSLLGPDRLPTLTIKTSFVKKASK